MRTLLLVILGLMVGSILAILVIKPFTSSDGRDSGAVASGPIEQPAPKP